ncbi:MAG: hypothetical protein LUC93_17740 [Planctomycetaceae bacterium]|nr:hypothetical protein [Planctomycetaceae bacterium]
MAENTTDAPQGTTDKFEQLSNTVAMKADRIKWVVLAVVIVALAAIAIFSYVRRSNAARERAAQDQVFQSIMDMQATPETADAMAVFGRQAKDFQGMPAGAQAQLLQFAFAYNTQEYVVAEQAAREFIRAYPRSPMLSRTKLALGQALLQQGKIGDAMSQFRELIAANDSETFAEAKLALAQALEADAEQVRDNPEEYRRRLEAAEMEYNDIISRSRIVGSARGFWPQAVTLPADYALVQLRDRLAGHELGEPTVTETPITDQEREAVMAIAPPTAGTDGTEAPIPTGDPLVDARAAIAAAARAADAALEAGATAARDRLDALAVAAGQESEAVRAVVTDTVKAGFNAVIDASDNARRAVEEASSTAIADLDTVPADAEDAAEQLTRRIMSARATLDESVTAGADAIASAGSTAQAALEAIITKAESVAVAREVIDLHGQTALGAVSTAATDAMQIINDAALKAAGDNEAIAAAVGESATSGYDTVDRIAAETRTALEAAAREAVGKLDELANAEGAPNEIADAITGHVADARAALDASVKNATDAVGEAVRTAVAAIEETARAAAPTPEAPEEATETSAAPEAAEASGE